MSDSERYMLIFSLTIFFGMMALGLMVIHANNKTQKQMERVITQRNLALAGINECYEAAQYEKLIANISQQKNMKHFLQSRISDQQTLNIYMDTSPQGNGRFLVMANNIKDDKTEKACIIAAGENPALTEKNASAAP